MNRVIDTVAGVVHGSGTHSFLAQRGDRSFRLTFSPAPAEHASAPTERRERGPAERPEPEEPPARRDPVPRERRRPGRPWSQPPARRVPESPLTTDDPEWELF